MTAPDRDQDTGLFVVTGWRGGQRLRITAASPVAAAEAAAFWRSHPGQPVLSVEWCLREDLLHRRPVLLFTRDRDGVVHATDLVAGKPVSAHPATCCGTRLDGDTGAVRVCWQHDGPPCADCLAVVGKIMSC